MFELKNKELKSKEEYEKSLKSLTKPSKPEKLKKKIQIYCNLHICIMCMLLNYIFWFVGWGGGHNLIVFIENLISGRNEDKSISRKSTLFVVFELKNCHLS